MIGAASAIKVARAREIAGQHHAAVKLGRDPAAEKRVQVERATHTFGALAEKYLAQKRKGFGPTATVNSNDNLKGTPDRSTAFRSTLLIGAPLRID